MALIGLILFVALLFLMERKFPLRKATHSLRERLLPNVLMAVGAYVVSALIVRPVYYWGIDNAPWDSHLNSILGFLSLDLSFYYWHRLNHKSPFLWRFHNCHHSDPDLDSTTAFRFHPVEVAFSSSLRLCQGAIIAPTLGLLLAFETIFQLCTFFHHSNISLPKKLDQAISLFFVTPRMHGIHHSNYKAETNSNYGVIFSFWDRIHGTFRNAPPQFSIKIGVPGYSDSKCNKIRGLILAPFKKQNDYWKGRIKRPSSQDY